MMKTSKVLHRNPAKTWFSGKNINQNHEIQFFREKYGKTNFVLVCYSKEKNLKDTVAWFRAAARAAGRQRRACVRGLHICAGHAELTFCLAWGPSVLPLFFSLLE